MIPTLHPALSAKFGFESCSGRRGRRADRTNRTIMPTRKPEACLTNSSLRNVAPVSDRRRLAFEGTRCTSSPKPDQLPPASTIQATGLLLIGALGSVGKRFRLPLVLTRRHVSSISVHPSASLHSHRLLYPSSTVELRFLSFKHQSQLLECYI
ncbi:hypothetical protein C8R47DRAFT_597392 [Mycena vitilis]|nr:hypothetical protein C8R47DRAFT_597392 [Mycena vitilis]